MTLDECTDLLTPIAIAMRIQLDLPTFMAYHAMLKTVPLELAAIGLDQWRKTGPRFFPSAPEIQSFAEMARRQQLALYPWTPCVECEDTPRWRQVTDAQGISRLGQCPCVARHKQSLEDHGLLESIASLPGEAGVGENEQVFPDAKQLPADIKGRLDTISSQKVLR